MSCFIGEGWFATTLLVPGVLGLDVAFKGVVPEVLFVVLFAFEEGDDNNVAIFALPKLSLFLCFFSLSFSPLKKKMNQI